MSNEVQKLIHAIEGHLQSLKANGVRYVQVSPETLADLQRPAPRASASTPAFVSASPNVGTAVAGSVRSNSGSVVQPPPAPPLLEEREGVRSSVPTEIPPPTSLAPQPASAGLTREAKEAAMADLLARALACQKCPNLASSRKNVVFGVGDMHTDLMFVGEAPGADEDTQGEPFVGAAGQLLTRIIQTMGYSRQTVYIANILKCRPDTPGQSSGNRKPTPDEMKTCLPYLLAQIDLIQPKVIVALGATAVEGLFGKANAGITKQRGNWMRFRETPVMPTYHPAYLLRNQAMSEKRRVWEDMLQVLERLGRPISEKQRGYFLKA